MQWEETLNMLRKISVCAAGAVLFAVSLGAGAALAQKSGGTLKVYHRGTPPSGSIHEEATNSTLSPYMPVFNNLVMYDQSKPTNSIAGSGSLFPTRSTVANDELANLVLASGQSSPLRRSSASPASRTGVCTG